MFAGHWILIVIDYWLLHYRRRTVASVHGGKRRY